MNDLISRQALMKEFSDFVRASNSSDFAQTPTWNDAVSLVGSMPSAQPELKKGKWIITKTERGWNCAEYPTEVTCSNCNYIEDYQKALDFCPNCGADMRGEQDG